MRGRHVRGLSSTATVVEGAFRVGGAVGRTGPRAADRRVRRRPGRPGPCPRRWTGPGAHQSVGVQQHGVARGQEIHVVDAGDSRRAAGAGRGRARSGVPRRASRAVPWGGDACGTKAGRDQPGRTSGFSAPRAAQRARTRSRPVSMIRWTTASSRTPARPQGRRPAVPGPVRHACGLTEPALQPVQTDVARLRDRRHTIGTVRGSTAWPRHGGLRPPAWSRHRAGNLSVPSGECPDPGGPPR